MSIKFRPEGRFKKYVLQSIRKDGHLATKFYITSFRERRTYHDGPHRGPILRMFARAHYLTSHAPEPVYQAHKQLRHYWDKKLDRKASIRYCNTRTLHRFL